MTKIILQKQQNGAWKIFNGLVGIYTVWQRTIDPKPKHWHAQYCDACRAFIQFLHIDHGNIHNILGFFDVNGINLSGGIDYPTDSFSEWLDWEKMPQHCAVLCESCFNHWKIPPAEGRTLIR